MDTKVFQLEDLTRKFIEDFYHREIGNVQKKLHSQVMWIGTAEGQYRFGFNRVSSYVQDNGGSLCQVTHLNYDMITNSGEFNIVVGKFYLSGEEKRGKMLRILQRVTAIWVKEKEIFKILHFHMSNNSELTDKNELFPHRLEKEIYEYVNQIVEKKLKGVSYSLKDHENCIHLLKDTDIYYLEANKNYVIWHCKSGQIITNSSLVSVEASMSEAFLRIHKSFIINRDYVKSIRRCCVQMQNGDLLQISVKKYCEIKKKLLGE